MAGGGEDGIGVVAVSALEQVRLLAAISKGTDNVIDGHWRWRNEDGTTEERTGNPGQAFA